MTEPRPRLLFSVIIPTRNRASLFAVALQSVLDQRFREFEVIAVDDGSSEEHAACYRDAVAAVADKVRLLTLVRTQRGHGQAYALNFGTAHAQGDYCCFLDDDDQWTDPEHLSRTAATILACAEPVDLALQVAQVAEQPPQQVAVVLRALPLQRQLRRPLHDRRLHRGGPQRLDH